MSDVFDSVFGEGKDGGNDNARSAAAALIANVRDGVGIGGKQLCRPSFRANRES